MVEVVYVAVRVDCRFKDVFWCITFRKCKKVVYVAVVGMMLAVIWHLLFNEELFVEEGFSKVSVRVLFKVSNDGGLSLVEVAGVLGCAVRVVSAYG